MGLFKEVTCLDTGEVCSTYKQYLKSDHWINFKKSYYRDKQINPNNGNCSKCNQLFRLYLHHLTYKNLGNEKFSDVTHLCQECHKKEHPELGLREKSINKIARRKNFALKRKERNERRGIRGIIIKKLKLSLLHKIPSKALERIISRLYCLCGTQDIIESSKIEIILKSLIKDESGVSNQKEEILNSFFTQEYIKKIVFDEQKKLWLAIDGTNEIASSTSLVILILKLKHRTDWIQQYQTSDILDMSFNS